MRNLRTRERGTIRAIGEVEGEYWYLNHRWDVWGVTRAIKRLRRGAPSVIYGHHGWNVYDVQPNGEVVFVKRINANMRELENARTLGFRIESTGVDSFEERQRFKLERIKFLRRRKSRKHWDPTNAERIL